MIVKDVRVEEPSEVTVDSAELSLDPGEGALVVNGYVVGGVLELGDEHEPHVDDEVRAAIKESYGRGAILVTEEREGDNGQSDANIRKDDVRALLLSEERRPGREVVHTLLALELLVGSDVLGEVERPAEQQMLGDGSCRLGLAPGKFSGHFASSRGHMDLIASQVVRVGVVTIFLTQCTAEKARQESEIVEKSGP